MLHPAHATHNWTPLFNGDLDDVELNTYLEPVGFADVRGALYRLHSIAKILPEAPTAHSFLDGLVLHLQATPDPDQALIYMERFLDQLVGISGALTRCTEDPRQAEMLVTLFAGSAFLAEILIRTPEYFEEIGLVWTAKQKNTRLQHQTSPAEAALQAQAALHSSEDPEEQLNALHRYHRRELLRIGAADLFGLQDLPNVTDQISRLADHIVSACLKVSARQTRTVPDGFVVLGMGKLGGQELNYSSDIDLVFLVDGNPSAMTRLGQRLIRNLSELTGQGFFYRVDMRLRPWGRSGSLVSTPESYLSYLEKDAWLWEKQALLKARPIAGDHHVGRTFLQRIEPILFATNATTVRAEIHAMKSRIEEELHKKSRGWGEVKLGKGSIRDVEFITQYLQLIHGSVHPEVRSPQTLDGLHRLQTAGFLSTGEYQVLADGYTFLRTVEHFLQLVGYQQKHKLPKAPAEVFKLARKLDFDGPEAGQRFLDTYHQHSVAIRAVYQTHLDPEATPSDPAADLARALPKYAATFSEADRAHHVALMRLLDDETPVLVDPKNLGKGRWQVTIVGYDYLGELSLISGLFLAFGFNIVEGHVFTYEPEVARPGMDQGLIVDVFTVDAVQAPLPDTVWDRYTVTLLRLIRLLEKGQYAEAGGALVKEVVRALPKSVQKETPLQPVHITIDNQQDERYTVLTIQAPDTVGLLFELTNALALNQIQIAQVQVQSEGAQVRDVLYVTDHKGKKIIEPKRQQELRAATVLVKHFTHLIPQAPNPEAALLQFRVFISDLFARPNWPEEMGTLEQPEVLDALANLLGVSTFLWEDFLRLQYANLFPVLQNTAGLKHPKPKAELQTDLDATIASINDKADRDVQIRAFKNRALFRIDMRYILGHSTLFECSSELTDLAEVLVETVYRSCYADLERVHGTPMLEDGGPCPISICAFGKAGGHELGIASDLEVLFIFEADGQTQGGEKPLSNARFTERLVQAFARTLKTHNVSTFEIDLRLRPYGRDGALAITPQAFQRYYEPTGAAWPYERQSLVKLRTIAGDRTLGAHIETLRTNILRSLGPFDVAAMRAIRERQVRHLVQPGTFNAKYSRGAMVDAEYLVQGLQITHGQTHAAVLCPNTFKALDQLEAVGALTKPEKEPLFQALAFFRHLVAALRIVRGNARDLTVPPEDSEAFAFLARRMDARPTELAEQLHHHVGQIQALSKDLL